MLLLVFIGLAVAAAVVSSDTVIFIPAAVNAVASFWSNGVMANFRGDPQGCPDWAAQLSMLTIVLSVVFLALGLVLG